MNVPLGKNCNMLLLNLCYFTWQLILLAQTDRRSNIFTACRRTSSNDPFFKNDIQKISGFLSYLLIENNNYGIAL